MGIKVAIAMSGGVDSSVAAALLVEQGYEVIGLMLRLWSEPGMEEENRCCAPEAMALARRVAAQLDIPFYSLDAQQTFYDAVVKNFIRDYSQGITPNPCVSCNRIVRWEFLYDHARALGAEYLATGHYAQVVRQAGGEFELHRAVDHNKDQSYILHVLTQAKLQHALFPLGELTKPEVRAHARELSLPVADRAESQDLCFLGSSDYRSFLKRQNPAGVNEGPIVNMQGEVLGAHPGLAFYTIGQRKGLGISSPIPLYVIAKNIAENTLVVGTANELGRRDFYAGEFNWISARPPSAPFRAQVKIRYKAPEAWARIVPISEKMVQIRLDIPLRDVSPGQAAVIYDNERCLGGGIIQFEP